MQKILAASTRGYLGLRDQILRTAARQALQQERSHIDVNLLTQAVAEYH